MIDIIIIAIITQFIPEVKSAKLSDVVMAPVEGLKDAMDIAICKS